MLSAVGCTQAVLQDGQLSIVSRLQHLQTALWHKLETLKEAVEEVSHEVDDSDNGGKRGKLRDIKRDVESLVGLQKNLNEQVEKLKKDVLEETDTLKKSQSEFVTKLSTVLRKIEPLNESIDLLKRAVEEVKYFDERNAKKLVEGQESLSRKLALIEDDINIRLGSIERDVNKLSECPDFPEVKFPDIDSMKADLKNISSEVNNIKTKLAATISAALGTMESNILLKQNEVIQKLTENNEKLVTKINSLQNKQSELSSSISKARDSVNANIQVLMNNMNSIMPQISNLPEIKRQLEDISNQVLPTLDAAVQENRREIWKVDDSVSVLKDSQLALTASQGQSFAKMSDIEGKLEKLAGKIGSCSEQSGCRDDEVLIRGKCRRCANGYKAHKNLRCFRYSSEKKKFNEAKRSCEADSASLITWDKDNQDLISQLLTSSGSFQVWVQNQNQPLANDDSDEDDEDDGDDDDDSFNSGSPEISGVRRCPAAVIRRGSLRFSNKPCNSERNFICLAAVPVELGPEKVK